MRKFVLMRGAQGSGKSTFIKNVGWEPYTLSADTIRMQFQSPVLGLDGKYHVSSTNDRKVWKFLFDLLEERMARGEFVVIDATHAKTSAMGQYKKLADKYRYRGYVLDLSDVPLEQCLKGNKLREGYKYVPEDVIVNAVTRMKTEKVPGWLTVVKPDDWNLITSYDFSYHDYSQYKAVHHIGDIHGCYSALKKWLGEDLKLNPDELYIFCGDYLDRGIENGETLKWLISIKDDPNVVLLTGNHERHLMRHAFDMAIPKRDGQFLKNTLPQLEDAGIDKKDIRQFCRRLQQVELYEYASYRVLVTHGGFPIMPDPSRLSYIATDQFIDGVGDYSDDIDSVWTEGNRVEYIQVHGHRNIYRLPVKNGTIPNSFNLEQQVEFGGNLAVVTIHWNALITVEEFKNDVFNPNLKRSIPTVDVNMPVSELVEYMRQHPIVKERQRPNHISSFNFTRDAFESWNWDSINTKARGLFINTHTNEIVNRGYDKFFAVDEHKSTKASKLPDMLKFPLQAFVKENGYLGLLGYDSESDKLIFSSKSALSSDDFGNDYASRFESMFYQSFSSEGKTQDIKNYLKDNNLSLVFEVIDPEFDPHIIKYTYPSIIMLDAIYREVVFRKLPFNELLHLGEALGLPIKEAYLQFDTWANFYRWYKEKTKNDPKLFEENLLNIEGVVLEDQNQFMLKIKFPYYKFWKQMRGFSEMIGNKHESNIDKGWLWSPLHNEFYNWMLRKDRDYIKNTNIISLREQFYRER